MNGEMPRGLMRREWTSGSNARTMRSGGGKGKGYPAKERSQVPNTASRTKLRDILAERPDLPRTGCQFNGMGTINGTGSYQFLLTALDGQLPGGGGADSFRIEIT